MDDLSQESIEEAVRAARELAHAACFLCDVACRLVRVQRPGDWNEVAAEAIESSIRAAQTAFSLETASRGDTEPAVVLWLAIDAIAIAEECIGMARTVLEANLAPAVAR